MLKGTIFDYVPDMFQLDAFIKDRFGEKGRTMSDLEKRQFIFDVIQESGRSISDKDREEIIGKVINETKNRNLFHPYIF